MRGRAGGREWRLHVGTHKTATTHLQATLEALRPMLEATGTGVATLEQLRPAWAIDLRLRRAATWCNGAHLRREIETRLARHAALLPRMVVSEEEILGDAFAPLRRRPYPRAGLRVRALSSALRPAGLWLSVRRLDTFLPAAYATALKHGRPALDAAALRRRTLAAPPDWAAFVARLRRAVPDVPITVWDYDDYRANAPRILGALTGAAIERLPDLPDPLETRTPDDTAIRTVEALPQGASPRARAARVGGIYEASMGPRFALFSAAEAARLGNLHHHQLDAIAGLEGVELMRF